MSIGKAFVCVVACTALLAGAFAQESQRQGRRGGQGFGQLRGGGFGGGYTNLLSREDVQAELKMSQEQKDKLSALRPQRGRDRVRGAGGAQGGQRGQRGQRAGFDPEAMRQRQAEQDKAALAILDSKQQTRAKELLVQRLGALALVREEFQKELELSSSQRREIEALQDKQREATLSLMARARDGAIDQEEVRATLTKNGEILKTELGKVLTTDQAEQFRKMAGSPFKFVDLAR